MPEEDNSNSEEDYPSYPIIIPDCASLLLLMSGIYGMFQGIEIGHPIYTVLFTNLVEILHVFDEI
jgi:hypothetical protein